MPIKLCAWALSGAMRTALRACLSASEQVAGLTGPAAPPRWWRRNCSGREPLCGGSAPSRPQCLALRLADLVQHGQRAGPVGRQFQHLEAELLGDAPWRRSARPAPRARRRGPDGGLAPGGPSRDRSSPQQRDSTQAAAAGTGLHHGDAFIATPSEDRHTVVIVKRRGATIRFPAMLRPQIRPVLALPYGAGLAYAPAGAASDRAGAVGRDLYHGGRGIRESGPARGCRAPASSRILAGSPDARLTRCIWAASSHSAASAARNRWQRMEQALRLRARHTPVLCATSARSIARSAGYDEALAAAHRAVALAPIRPAQPAQPGGHPLPAARTRPNADAGRPGRHGARPGDARRAFRIGGGAAAPGRDGAAAGTSTSGGSASRAPHRPLPPTDRPHWRGRPMPARRHAAAGGRPGIRRCHPVHALRSRGCAYPLPEDGASPTSVEICAADRAGGTLACRSCVNWKDRMPALRRATAPSPACRGCTAPESRQHPVAGARTCGPIPARRQVLGGPAWTRCCRAAYRRVGVVWAGRPTHNNDSNRSTTLASIAARWARIPGTRAGVAAEGGRWRMQAGKLVRPRTRWSRSGPRSPTMATRWRSWPELDLLVSGGHVASAHLAGAMGRPAMGHDCRSRRTGAGCSAATTRRGTRPTACSANPRLAIGAAWWRGSRPHCDPADQKPKKCPTLSTPPTKPLPAFSAPWPMLPR